MTEGMNVKDYDYDLPEELIAQDPLEDRSSSRLMVLDRQTGDVEHRHFTDILEYLHPGDCLVINNTKGDSSASVRSERGHTGKNRSTFVKTQGK